tara:strand:- start:31 stop:777 length:747 start_codon:yes stop_codon:yes gene_type:complete
MKKAYLPKDLNYYTCDDLIRLGGKHDGGYLVSKSDVKKTNLLLSFGINDDWKFEKDFNLINSIPILAYDASTNFRLFLKRSLGALFRYNFTESLTKPFQYLLLKNFFSKKNTLIKKYVGIDSDENNISLNNIFKHLNEDQIFIKMDIEGSEYRCLDSIIENQSNITGAVIEFHDVDLNINRIINFIKNFNLKIAHIHANNYSLINKNIPLIIEVTFSKNANFSKSYPILPHKYDKPNNPKEDEIKLIF